MKIKNVAMLVTNLTMRENSDKAPYCSVGLLSMDDGQKFDVYVKEENIYFGLKPMTKITADLEITNSKYGLKLSIDRIVEVGSSI